MIISEQRKRKGKKVGFPQDKQGRRTDRRSFLASTKATEGQPAVQIHLAVNISASQPARRAKSEGFEEAKLAALSS